MLFHSKPDASLSETDAGFAKRIRAGEHAAFTELVKTYFDSAARVAYRILNSPEAARDSAQNTMAYFWEHRDRFFPKTSIKSYILGAARNTALKELRSRDVHERYPNGERSNEASVNPDDIQVSSDENVVINKTTIEAYLAKLPERRRLALELRYIEQMSYAEVAAVLEISPGAAEQLVIRSLAELRGE